MPVSLPTTPYVKLRHRLVGVAVACALMGGLATAAEAQQRGQKGASPAVTLIDVQMQKRNERIAAVGSGRARKQVTLTTRVAGVITDVLFEGGTRVKRGDPLVKLDAEPERIAVEMAEAQRAQAADTVARYAKLSEGTISRVAEAEAATALKVADAELRRARDQLDRMTIRAPFDGVMGLTDLQTGDYLAIGTPIASIDDRSTLLVEFTVPEAVAMSMKKGLPVRANLVARSGEVYHGTLQAVGTRIDPVSRTLSVRAEIPNPNLTLIPGSTFSVSVRLPGEEAPMLPAMAIQWDRQGAFVWRVKDDGAVERVAAAILTRVGDRVLLEAKLNAGDKVVHEGGDALREQQVVRAMAGDDAPNRTSSLGQ